MNTASRFKAALALVFLGMFVGCPRKSIVDPPYPWSPSLKILLWKSDGSGFITIVDDMSSGPTGTTFNLYDSNGSLQKTFPIDLNFPTGGTIAFIHNGADLLIPTDMRIVDGPHEIRTNKFSLADGSVNSYSNLYLEDVDPSGRLALFSEAPDYTGGNWPYGGLEIADVSGPYGPSTLRRWQQQSMANPSVQWTTPTGFTLTLVDSTNTTSLVGFDTALDRTSSVPIIDTNISNGFRSSFGFYYASANGYYYIFDTSNFFSLDPATGIQTNIDATQGMDNFSHTADGRYVAYAKQATKASFTRIRNMVSGAIGVLPASASRCAISPNGLHFAYSDTLSQGPVIHVVNVTLP